MLLFCLQIHQRKLTDDGRTSVTGSFVLDDSMGEPARFMLYTHNTEAPLIRSLSLVSPSHQEYLIRSDNMLSLKIISLVANISEVPNLNFSFVHYLNFFYCARNQTSSCLRPCVLTMLILLGGNVDVHHRTLFRKSAATLHSSAVDAAFAHGSGGQSEVLDAPQPTARTFAASC